MDLPATTRNQIENRISIHISILKLPRGHAANSRYKKAFMTTMSTTMHIHTYDAMQCRLSVMTTGQNVQTNKQTNKKRVEFLSKITQHLQREMDEFLDKITQHLQPLLAYLQLKKLTRKQLPLDFCVFRGISPSRRTLGHYAGGASPILHVPTFPWKYFHFTT
jgi:hypothetical protein